MRVWIFALLAWTAVPAFAATEITGTTPGGAAYRIAVPDGWQAGGPLVLLQHGFHQAIDRDPDLGPLLATQLASGYAVAASGYRQSGWALFTAIEDNAELVAAFTQRFGAPGPLYAVGGSMGGLVALKFAEDPRFRDRTRGVLAFCPVDDGLAAWDFAFDLRLTYDAVCADSSGELADGAQPYPWAYNLDDIPRNLGAFDLANVDLLRALADVAACTGIGIPAILRSGAQSSRLQQLKQFSGIGNEDFLVTNLAYATFGLGELLRAPDKLAGRNPFFNQVIAENGLPRSLAYGNTLLDARIRRVPQVDPFARFDFERSSRPDGSATARIVSIRTSKDELVAVQQPFATQVGASLYAAGAERLSATVFETAPSHCAFTPAELHAGWDALLAPTLNSATLPVKCEARILRGVTGPCRFASTGNVETVIGRPRQPFASALNGFGYAKFSSGAWFDPQRDGEGIVIEELGRPIGDDPTRPIAERRVLVTWYTYAPPGDANPGPRWLIGLGTQTSQGVHVPSMTMTRGARFGAAFNPADVVRSDWGSLSLTIDASRRMRVRYDGPPGWEGSIRNMTPLATVDLNLQPPPIGGPAPPDPITMVSASGAYFDPAHDGEGIQFQLLPGSTPATKRAFVVYYTYDTQGQQLWLTGAADNLPPLASAITFQMTRATGAVFGDTFNPATVSRIPWGTLTLTIQSQPDAAFLPGRSRVSALRWNSIDPAFGSGGYPLTRLTRVGAYDPREF